MHRQVVAMVVHQRLNPHTQRLHNPSQQLPLLLVLLLPVLTVQAEVVMVVMTVVAVAMTPLMTIGVVGRRMGRKRTKQSSIQTKKRMLSCLMMICHLVRLTMRP